MNERLKQVAAFLNPFNAAGGKLGRVAAPLVVTAAVMASQVIPGTPVNLLGLTELGGGAAELGAELVLGVDLSFSRADEAWWRDRYDAGARVGAQALWTGLQTPAPACDNLRDMKAAGVLPVGYLSLSDAYWGAQNVDFAYNACPDMWPRLLFVAIDIEMPLTNPQAQIEEAIARVRELGQAPVIYTSWNAWRSYVGVWVPPGIPLWNALWDGEPDVDYLGLPFGFTVLVGEQYTGGHDWDGVNVDRDVFDKRLTYLPPLPASIPAPTPAPTPLSTIDPPWPPLIKLANDPDVYVVVGGVKIHACSSEVFVAQGFRWEGIRVVAESDPLWNLPSWRCR